jgi:FkbM family methyltransferase
MLKQFIKRQLAIVFPDIIVAYHYYRNRKQYQRIQLKKLRFGFTLMCMNAMQDGTFEPEETGIILDNLKNIDVFVDIGANIGYYACIARHKGIKTIAVEPLAENLNILYENLKINGWDDVEVFPVGLAEKPGIADLYGENTSTSLLRGWAGNSEFSELWKRTIALSTLDILLGGRFTGQRLFIKIDVEGAEYEVLKGALKILALTPKPVWMVEICFTEHHAAGMNPNYLKIFELFWQNGYKAKTSDNDKTTVSKEDVRRWIKNMERDFGFINFIFE